MKTPRKIPEILAPAGGPAQFFAALNAGADAVYLGLKEFNARARAGNFTVEELSELVPLARRYGMKVLVTVNVLVKQAELPRLVETLAVLENLGVHAIIVQDLAVARLARAHFPSLRLHASTQMAVHNLPGVREAQRHGLRRVVLARELTAQEIRRIRQAVPQDEIEIEAFCHGSLCYSYSGLCFFSGAADARSGNRGECAYTCRQPYKILNEPGHGFLFSMRDLDSSKDLGTLVDTGVDTLKIEGRKKDAQYVSSVVRLYRRELDRLFGASTLRPEAPPIARELAGESAARVAEDLALTFQRQGTTFFLKGRYHENVIDLDNPTHRGVPVGTIREVHEHSLVVKTEAALERFDGLRVPSAGKVFHARPQDGERVSGDTRSMLGRYANEDLEFALREMRLNGKWVPTAPPGATVEILLPEGCPRRPEVGDIVFKTRSADLKRRVHELESPPADTRLRPLVPVEVRITLREESTALRLEAAVRKAGELLADARVELAREKARGPSRLRQDLHDTLAVFGDQGLEAEKLTIEGAEGGWFVPRSRIKELKHTLAATLASRYPRWVEDRKARALTAIDGWSRPPAPAGGEARFAVKLDRLETLRDLVALREFPVAEVVFEPKRAFLPSVTAAELARELVAAQESLGVGVRLALPTVIRVWDEGHLKKFLGEAAAVGLRRYEVGNLGAFGYLRDWNLESDDLVGDFTLYALNAEASRFWAEKGLLRLALSVEDDLDNLRAHLAAWPWELGLRPQAILFKDTPLFIAEACSLTALHDGCPTSKVCGYRTLEIEGPTGERFYVAHESCKSIVYGKQAYAIAHRRAALEALGVRDWRIDFLTRPYSRDNLEAVLTAVKQARPVPGTHSANFERSLL